MAEDKQTAQEDLEDVGGVLDDDLDFDAVEAEDLESAMQEALEAVEKASETARARRESGDEIRPPAVESDAETEGEVARLEETVAELRDRSKRTLADFENFRRRVDRERQEDRRYAAFDVLKEFLAVVDNLDRALASGGSTDELKVGVELIHVRGRRAVVEEQLGRWFGSSGAETASVLARLAGESGASVRPPILR